MLALAFLASLGARAQIVITGFNQNGLLVCSNLNPGSVAAVQWACSLAGPWQTNWPGATNLVAVAVDSSGAFTVNVPKLTANTARFYRVVGVAAATNPISITIPAGMAVIPAGWFTMGDTLDGETDAVPTNIYVSQFFMDINLVTYGLWQTVYSNAISQGYGFDHTGAGTATNHPAQTVDWWDCVKWCNARSQLEGLTPVYYTDAGLTQVYTNGQLSPSVNWSANGYRLPTEAEWEKAARGGLSGLRFPWGNTISETQANYYADPTDFAYDLATYSGFNATFDTHAFPYISPYTSPVGYFAPNGYGLYDMAGNVTVWCWDFYGTPYGQPSTNNPTGAPTGFRVLRGCSWIGYADFARCANREWTDNPVDADVFAGLRCVRAY